MSIDFMYRPLTVGSENIYYCSKLVLFFLLEKCWIPFLLDKSN